MDAEAMSEALDAIHDEAEKLLSFDLPDDVNKGLELIISIARYKFDNRSAQEKTNIEDPLI